MNPEGNGGDCQPPSKTKRGPYKKYLYDPSVPIPASTLWSRQLKAQRAAAPNSNLFQEEHRPPSPGPAEAEHVGDLSAVDLTAENVDRLHQEEGGPAPEAEQTASPQHEPQSANTEEVEERTPKQKKSYVDKHHLNGLLHRDFKVTRLDALLMILHLAVRHCHTQHFIEDQIKFVNTLFGGTVLDVSYHIFKTLFKPSARLCKHYVCLECNLYLGVDEDFFHAECPQCHKIISKSSSKSVNSVVCMDCKVYLGLKEDFAGSLQAVCPNCSQILDLQQSSGCVACLDCKLYLGSEKTCFKKTKFSKCPKCQKQINVHSVDSKNYFITLSLREQIQELLAKPGLKFVTRSDRNPTVISDVFDGEIYQKLSQNGSPLADENALTGTFNTDGVQVFKSSNDSLYPIWMHINEVVPEQRFKQENLILAGLWFGKSAPSMSLFLKPFTEELIDLSLNGVDYTRPDGTKVKCPVFPLMCSVDSVCKPKVLCQKQFNAKMGCSYCYHPNDSTIGDDMKLRYYDNYSNYNLRKEEEVIRDMFEADELQRKGELKNGSVNGFLGISILLTFTKLLDFFPHNTFDIVWGVVIDYLHATLEGVTEDLFNIFENILTPEELKILDERIRNITPPQGMTRRPRSFTLRPFWKAKEFRAVLLYYCLPCLEDLLPPRNFANLKHFVNALHVLLSDSISATQLSAARSSLNEFTVGYQRLYGLQNVSYNLHLCKHLVHMVTQLGPLFCYSNFVFESGNGYLINLIRGTKSVINEIAIKHTTIQTVSKFISENNVSASALKFCSEVIQCDYRKSQMELDGVLVTGSQAVSEVNVEECLLLQENNVMVNDSKVQYFNRVIRNGIVYSCKSYTKSKAFDDSCVQLKDGSYAVIDKLVKSNRDVVFCLIKPIRIAVGSDIIPPIKRCCYDVFDSCKVVPFSDISRKCFFVSVSNKSYVCHFPNFHERD